MEIARIRVRQSALELDQSACITKGMVGAVVIFDGFGPEWAGLSKTAVFRTRTASRDVANVQEGKPVVIPWEVLEAVLSDLQVGICGHNIDGTLVIPTVWGSLGKIAAGAIPVNRPSEPPTPDWTTQIEWQVNQALTEAQAVRPLARQAAEAASCAADYASAAEGHASAAAASADTIDSRCNRAVHQAEQQANESKGAAEVANKALKLAVDNARAAQDARDAAADSANRTATSEEIADSAAQAAANKAVEAATQARLATQEAARSAEAAALSVSHGVAGAKKGDIFRIAKVDGNGVPTTLEPVSAEDLESKWEIVKKTVIPNTGDITVVSATGLTDAQEVGVTFTNAGIIKKDIPEMQVNTYFKGGGFCRFAFTKPFEYANSCGFMRVRDAIPEGTRGPDSKFWIDQISTTASSVFQNIIYETIEVATHPLPMPKGLEIVFYAKRRR